MYMAPIDKATATPVSFTPVQRRAVVGPTLANEDFPRLVRFTGVTAGLTLLAAVLYCGGALLLSLAPQVANGAAAMIATGMALLLRRRFGRLDGGATAVVAVASVGFALNAGWVWLAVTACGEAVWTPVTPMLLGTPLATVAAARAWVLR